MTLTEHMRWCLTAPVATTVLVGEALEVHANDAFATFIGPARHAAVLGRPAREAFADLWDVIEPLALRAPCVANGVRLAFDRTRPNEEVFATLIVTKLDGAIAINWLDTTQDVVEQHRSASAPERELKREPRPAPARPRKRVLIVEDNDDTARALKTALELLGYEVALAHNGPVALTVARTFRPDVALLDIGLPVMDGYELANRLRAMNIAAKQLHVVAVTGYGGESYRQKSEDSGFADHLVKPVDLAQLERVVEDLS